MNNNKNKFFSCAHNCKPTLAAHPSILKAETCHFKTKNLGQAEGIEFGRNGKGLVKFSLRRT